MIYSKQSSSSSSWGDCQHQQQIAILQQKLMEIHNKLIDQLDICKEQELTIIDLNKKLADSQSNKANNFDTFKYQSFGMHNLSLSSKENQTPNYKIHYNHDSRDSSYQTKTELLQADLEAMRNKVLIEITEKNRLKEEIKEMKLTQKKEMNMQAKKVEGLQSLLRKGEVENEQLREKLERAKREYRSQLELDRLTTKINESENRYKKEKEHNRLLEDENVQLTAKIEELTDQIYRLEKQYQSKERKIIYHDQQNNQRDLEVDRTYPTKTKLQEGRDPEPRDQRQTREQRLDRQQKQRQQREQKQQREQRQQREEQTRQRQQQRQRQNRQHNKVRGQKPQRKRQGFEQTKQLIKKLEQAQINMRKNRKQN